MHSYHGYACYSSGLSCLCLLMNSYVYACYIIKFTFLSSKGSINSVTMFMQDKSMKKTGQNMVNQITMLMHPDIFGISEVRMITLVITLMHVSNFINTHGWGLMLYVSCFDHHLISNIHCLAKNMKTFVIMFMARALRLSWGTKVYLLLHNLSVNIHNRITKQLFHFSFENCSVGWH